MVTARAPVHISAIPRPTKSTRRLKRITSKGSLDLTASSPSEISNNPATKWTTRRTSTSSTGVDKRFSAESNPQDTPRTSLLSERFPDSPPATPVQNLHPIADDLPKSSSSLRPPSPQPQPPKSPITFASEIGELAAAGFPFLSQPNRHPFPTRSHRSQSQNSDNLLLSARLERNPSQISMESTTSTWTCATHHSDLVLTFPIPPIRNQPNEFDDEFDENFNRNGNLPEAITDQAAEDTKTDLTQDAFSSLKAVQAAEARRMSMLVNEVEHWIDWEANRQSMASLVQELGV